MIKRFASATLALALTGCAGVSYILENYKGAQPVTVVMPDDRYRIFEHPTKNAIMSTPSIGSAAGIGVAKGLTFGAVNNVAPKPRFEAAVATYLAKTGRAHCTITDTYLLAEPQYESLFTCKNGKPGKEPFTPYPVEDKPEGET